MNYPSGFTSPYFRLGLFATAFLMLLALGFRTAPAAASQQLSKLFGCPTPELNLPKADRHIQVATPPYSTHEQHQFPLFPACTSVPDFAKRKECSEKAMLSYIYERITYPKKAKEAGASGIVVLRFPVDALGVTGLPIVVRSPHPALANESLRVVKRMLRSHPVWQPAREGGKPVVSEMHLPIQFKPTKG